MDESVLKRTWSGFKLVLVVAWFIVLAATSVYMAFQGNPMGYAGTALFVGGPVLMGVAHLRSHDRLVRPTFTTGTLPGAERFTTETEGRLCAAHWTGFLPALFGCLMFVVIGVALLFAGWFFLPFGVLCLVTFGPFLLSVIPGLLGRRQGVLLLPDGAWCRMPGGNAWLPRESISSATPVRGGLGIRLYRDRRGEGLRLFGLAKFWRPVQRRLAGVDMSLSTLALPGRVDEIVDALNDMRPKP